VFILQETEAGAYGEYFDMEPLLDAVETELSDPSRHKRTELTEIASTYLEQRIDAIRCLLLRDRPGQQELDEQRLTRFREELVLVDDLEVIYRLPDHDEERSEPSWFIESPEGVGEGRRRTPYVHVPEGEGLEDNTERLAKALCEYLEYNNIGDVVLVMRTDSDQEREERLDLLDAPRELLQMNSLAGNRSGGIGLGEVTNPSDRGVQDDDPLDEEESPNDDDFSDPSIDGDRGTDTDPAERLWDPDELAITIDEGETIDSKEFNYSPTEGGSPGGTGSRTSESGPSPGAGGIREAINQHGRELAYRYECARFSTEWPDEDPRDYVFHVDDRSQIIRAKKSINAKPVLEWLTGSVGLDFTYPGFDILTVHPESTDAEPAVDRVIEVKSKMEDGPVDISLNEWYTANEPELQDLYHLYVVANLGRESGLPFVRTVGNPSDVLRAERQQRTSVSLEVDTTRFTEGGDVREIPLSEDE
jgi:hypothetical protein